MFCHTCGAELNNKGPFCSACGSPTGTVISKVPSRPRLGLSRVKTLILLGLAVVLTIWLLSHSEGPQTQETASSEETTGQTEAPTVPSSRFEAQMPTAEQGFIQAIQQGQAAFHSASNEMAQGGTRAQRRSAICQSLENMTVSNWIGRVEELSSNSEGRGVLELSLAPGIRLETWNNALSDISDRTLIDPSSSLFAALSQMKKGDQVIFSGTFIQSDIDCVKESSLSLSGSMEEPEFVFRFASARPVSIEEPPVSGGSNPQAYELPPVPVQGSNPTDIPRIEASRFLAEYQADERAASARYKDKRVAVTGILSGVFIPPIDVSVRMAAKGVSAHPFVTIGGPRPSSPEETLLLPGITARSPGSSLFGRPNTAALDNELRVGNTVTLVCTCGEAFRVSDLVIGQYNDSADYSIQLYDCTLTTSPGRSSQSQPENENPPEDIKAIGAAPPRALYTPDAEYTQEATDARLQGTVQLSAIVGIDGRTHDVQIVHPLGMGLDEKAVKTVERWTFTPAMKNGQPVPMHIDVTMNFRLY